MMLGCLLDSLAYIILLTTDHYGLLLVSTAFFGLSSTLFSTNARAFLLSSAQDTFLKISSLA